MLHIKQTKTDLLGLSTKWHLVCSLGFLFASYILVLELKKPATWKHQQLQTKISPNKQTPASLLSCPMIFGLKTETSTHAWTSSLPWPALQFLDLPAPTVAWANSFKKKLLSLYAYIQLILFLWRPGDLVWAAITYYHRLRWFIQQTYFSQSWRLEVWDGGASIVEFLVSALFLCPHTANRG